MEAIKVCNISIIFKNNSILMFIRDREPFKGLYNCPGGKLEKYDLSNLTGAYRELFEETNITTSDITLELYGTFKVDQNTLLDVYVGDLLNSNVKLISEGAILEWIDIPYILDPENSNKFASHLVSYIQDILNFRTITS